MNCSDAYRAALTRELSSGASSAPASTPEPRRRHAHRAAATPVSYESETSGLDGDDAADAVVRKSDEES